MSGLEALAGGKDRPLAPSWRVSREFVLERDSQALVRDLAALTEGGEHYWVLEQGPLSPGSLRQSLLNLDSDIALAGALRQTFQRDGAPACLTFQQLPRQEAAGVLFTRHPMRPDLDHIVIEGNGTAHERQRVILHADGAIAWHSDNAGDLLSRIGPAPFHALATWLTQKHDSPRAAEWVWDGTQLWLVQALPIGSLPMPKEVWTRRAGLGFSNQAISPLWYTMLGRWLKEGFWRPLGRKAGWDDLGNIEPYRRQHSQLYANGRFIKALQQWRPELDLWWAIPPAWRDSTGAAEARPHAAKVRRALRRLRLVMLEARLTRRHPLERDPERLWLDLMKLDHMGEALASIEGHLGYVTAPTVHARGGAPMGLSKEQTVMLRDLGQVMQGTLDWNRFQRRYRHESAGDDPVFARFGDVPAGNELMTLQQNLAQVPDTRMARLLTLDMNVAHPDLVLRQRAAAARHRLGGRIREVLRVMAERLVEQGVLKHPDDIHFLYFDELWQAWRGELTARAEKLLGERKVRFLSDAHAGPPDWIIDGVGYGTSPLGQTQGRETVRGYPLVEVSYEGRVQRLGSGWQLNQVQAGDVVVMDQCDPGWLPWLVTAGALVLAHRDPFDPAASLACALDIPCVWGVDDAMHCLVDGSRVEVQGDTGVVRQVQ